MHTQGLGFLLTLVLAYAADPLGNGEARPVKPVPGARVRGFAQLDEALSNAAVREEGKLPLAPMQPLGLEPSRKASSDCAHPRIWTLTRLVPARLGGLGVTRDYTARPQPAPTPPATPVVSVRTLLVLGDQAFRKANLARALKSYRHAIALEPDNAASQLAVVEVQFATQNLFAAGDLLMRVLRGDPGVLRATIDRAALYPDPVILERAMAALTREVAFDRDNTGLQILLAYLRVTTPGDPAAAQRAVDELEQQIGDDQAVDALRAALPKAPP